MEAVSEEGYTTPPSVGATVPTATITRPYVVLAIRVALYDVQFPLMTHDSHLSTTARSCFTCLTPPFICMQPSTLDRGNLLKFGAVEKSEPVGGS